MVEKSSTSNEDTTPVTTAIVTISEPNDESILPTVKSNTKVTSVPNVQELKSDGTWIDVPITSKNQNIPTTNVPITPTPFSTSNRFMTLQNDDDEVPDDDKLSDGLEGRYNSKKAAFCNGC